jgi:hypothetical protein
MRPKEEDRRQQEAMQDVPLRSDGEGTIRQRRPSRMPDVRWLRLCRRCVHDVPGRWDDPQERVMHLTKAAGKELERLGLLPKQEKKPNPYAPYRSKWEQDYAEHLKDREAAGLIICWHYELCSFELVPPSATQRGVRYTPDFIVMAGQIGAIQPEIHEVKGHWRPGSKHKVKALAHLLKHVNVYAVRKVDGMWHLERF